MLKNEQKSSTKSAASRPAKVEGTFEVTSGSLVLMDVDCATDKYPRLSRPLIVEAGNGIWKTEALPNTTHGTFKVDCASVRAYLTGAGGTRDEVTHSKEHKIFVDRYCGIFDRRFFDSKVSKKNSFRDACFEGLAPSKSESDEAMRADSEIFKRAKIHKLTPKDLRSMEKRTKEAGSTEQRELYKTLRGHLEKCAAASKLAWVSCLCRPALSFEGATVFSCPEREHEFRIKVGYNAKNKAVAIEINFKAPVR